MSVVDEILAAEHPAFARGPRDHLRRGARPGGRARRTRIDATPPGRWTATALHTAAGQGHVAAVELLLARGADPSIQDARYQSTPLGRASHPGRDDVVALLTELTR